jgi:uncharacterized membrane protein
MRIRIKNKDKYDERGLRMTGTVLMLFLSITALMSFILIILGLLPQPEKGNQRQLSLTIWGLLLGIATVILFYLEPTLFPA